MPFQLLCHKYFLDTDARHASMHEGEKRHSMPIDASKIAWKIYKNSVNRLLLLQ